MIRKPYIHDFSPNTESVSKIKKFIVKQRDSNIKKLRHKLPKIGTIILQKQISKNGTSLTKQEITANDIKNTLADYDNACQEEESLCKCIDDIAKWKRELIELAGKINSSSNSIAKEVPSLEMMEKLEEVCKVNESMKQRVSTLY